MFPEAILYLFAVSRRCSSAHELTHTLLIPRVLIPLVAYGLPFFSG
jgi:hypothetical protein